MSNHNKETSAPVIIGETVDQQLDRLRAEVEATVPADRESQFTHRSLLGVVHWEEPTHPLALDGYPAKLAGERLQHQIVRTGESGDAIARKMGGTIQRTQRKIQSASNLFDALQPAEVPGVVKGATLAMHQQLPNSIKQQGRERKPHKNYFVLAWNLGRRAVAAWNREAAKSADLRGFFNS